MALGGLEYATAPINAPLHTIVGKPIAENIEAAGVPRPYAELAGNIAEAGATMALPVPKGIPRFGAAGKIAEAAVPTVEELKAAATKGFKSPEVEQLVVKPSALQGWAQQLKTQLTDIGADDVNANKVWQVLDKLDKAPADSFVTGKNLKSLRESFAGLATPEPAMAAKTRNPLAATMVIHSLDDFVGAIPKGDILRGDPAKVAAIWNEARGNYAAAMRSEKIGGAVENAELQAGSAHSGQNIDNATRQQIKAILKNPKARRGYSDEELAQMRRIVVGAFTGDAARYVANLAGKGGGLGAVAAASAGAYSGGQVGGPIGAIIGGATPIIGYAFGKLSNAITAKEVAKLDTLIRSRSPLGAQLKGPLQDWSKAAVALEGSPTPRNMAKVMLASTNLANNLKDAGIAVAAEDIIQSIQGPTPAEAKKGDKEIPRITVHPAQRPAGQEQQ
jgi:hypothetical protein